MRALLVVLSLLFVTTTADAKRRRTPKRVATAKIEKQKKKTGKKKPPKGQSIGAPWSGTLRAASRFRELAGTHIRRPPRTYATRTTIEYTRRAIEETLEQFPESHVFAIGDFSQKGGGWISEHHSHQSGRDVDLGLFYKDVPDGYPDNFVTADEDTLDARRMWTLIAKLASTRNDDGGVLMMFLDFEVQGVIYHWAQEHGVGDDKLERIFQFPHGRGASAGLVRHEPNHGNHLHVRFRCADEDVACR